MIPWWTPKKTFPKGGRCHPEMAEKDGGKVPKRTQIEQKNKNYTDERHS